MLDEKKKRKERYFIYHENRIDSQEIYYPQLQFQLHFRIR